MKAMVLRSPAGLDRLSMEDRPEPGTPGPGEIRVTPHGSSLNFHDLGVATGRMPTANGRIPLADGAASWKAWARMSPSLRLVIWWCRAFS